MFFTTVFELPSGISYKFDCLANKSPAAAAALQQSDRGARNCQFRVHRCQAVGRKIAEGNRDWLLKFPKRFALIFIRLHWQVCS